MLSWLTKKNTCTWLCAFLVTLTNPISITNSPVDEIDQEIFYSDAQEQDEASVESTHDESIALETDYEENNYADDLESEEVQIPNILLDDEIIIAETKSISNFIDLANPQDGIGYMFEDDILTIYESGAYRITGGTTDSPLRVSIKIEADASVDLDNVVISSDAAITIAPNIKLSIFISGGNIISSNKEAGIAVPKGARLTINGNGSLIAKGGVGAVFSNPIGCAGIGSGVNMEGGSIIINGGDISAYGGDITQGGGAGIGTGGSRGSGGMATLESIEINGGTVFAQGGESAAGIGTGVGRNSGTTSIDRILINGGAVTCDAGSWAAEIGTGEAFSSGVSSIDSIVIAGGIVNATAMAEGGAAIGTGEAYNSSTNTINLIRILGGNITASGGPHGAGIGAGRGYNTSSLSHVDCIEISGGLLKIQGGTGGAGIGAGLAQNNGGSSSVGQIIVNGGALQLKGGLSASGIGSGRGHSRGISKVDSIMINDGSLNISNDMEGFEGGAAIGSGEGSNNGQSIVDNVTIRDGSIYAVGGNGASGIGSGEAFNSGISRVENVNIEGGTISKVRGGINGAGIGAGLTTNSSGTSTVGSIRITGGEINIEGGDFASGIGAGQPHTWSTVDYLEISNAVILAYAGESANAIHIETGKLNIDSSAFIHAFALDRAAISTSMYNDGSSRLVNAFFSEEELDNDFYIRSANSEIQVLLPYPHRYFAFTGLESEYNLIGGYNKHENLTVLDITDPDNPSDTVICDHDLALRHLMVEGVIDGYFIEYRANGASGDSPDDPNLYQSGETATVMDQGDLYWEGLSFAGWNTRPNGKGRSFQAGDSFIIEETVILYSQWKGDGMINKVPDISFENLVLNNRDALYHTQNSDRYLNLTSPASQWRLSAFLGGVKDSLGNHDAIPGACVILKGGLAESESADSSPWVSPNAEIHSGGGATLIARSNSDIGIRSWTIRWDVADESGIALYVPGGEGSAGSQVATITWVLEDVP